ncbi:MAG: deoxyribose-phosphate aldolase [Alphaproteobacteria bacterium]|jgi:deoxyribose-phosphate aldolase|nr:deoxyribose-phosphate aldolase [Alphaproteobacteria bacterium]
MRTPRKPLPFELPADLADLVERAGRATPAAGSGRWIFRLMDLTALGDAEDERSVEVLCGRAVRESGQAAAVVVAPRFVPRAARCLADSGVRLGSTVNYPEGDTKPMAVRAEAERVIGFGAEEIDLVFPYRAFLAGDSVAGPAIVAAAKAACGPSVTLKVILETPAFKEAEPLSEAARVAVREGADFLATSTGLFGRTTTLDGTALLLDAVKGAEIYEGRRVGIKPCGGIEAVSQAIRFLALVDAGLGRHWLQPQTFRIAGDGLMRQVLET